MGTNDIRSNFLFISTDAVLTGSVRSTLGEIGTELSLRSRLRRCAATTVAGIGSEIPRSALAWRERGTSSEGPVQLERDRSSDHGTDSIVARERGGHGKTKVTSREDFWRVAPKLVKNLGPEGNEIGRAHV